MGMFDWIRIDNDITVPVPPQFLKDLPKFEFQTKSLQKVLNTYTIKKEGLFFIDKSGRLVNYNFHGILDFYSYYSTDLVDYLFDFKAKYTDGVLVELKLSKFEEHFHESNKEKFKRLKNKQKQLLNHSLSYKFQNIFISFFGLPSSLSKGSGHLEFKNFSIIFYCPKILIFSKGSNSGFYISKIDTGFKFTNSLYEKSFLLSVFGFGFCLYRNIEI